MNITGPWQALADILVENIAAAVFLLIFVFLLMAGALVYLFCLFLSLKKRYRCLLLGRDKLNIEELLNHYGALIEEGQIRLKDMDQRLTMAEKQLVRAVSAIGLHRYNAFHETGSDLSFSLAFLDHNEDGVVITSIFGREESRAYGKPIHRGKSIYYLSEEELIALQEARRNLKRTLKES